MNEQSGAYGHRRKQLINNLFKTVIENALPGFIEYLFYGYEESDKETSFLYHKNSVQDQVMESNITQEVAESIEDPSNEDSYQQELLGVDPVTGKEFTRVRKRKPMRYYIPGLIGGRKNTSSIK